MVFSNFSRWQRCGFRVFLNILKWHDRLHSMIPTKAGQLEETKDMEVDAMLVHPPAHSDASGHACHYLLFTENISQGLQDPYTEKK